MHPSRTWPWWGVTAATLAVAALPGLSLPLELRGGVALWSQPWRLWSGHLVHGSPEHLAWNVGAWLALALLFGGLPRTRWTALLVAAPPAVALGTMLLQPELASYRGLSGWLNAVWVAGALGMARRERASGRLAWSRLFELCVLADVVKIGLESALARPLFTSGAELGGIAVPLAHALGALAGAAIALWPSDDREERQPSREPRRRVRAVGSAFHGSSGQGCLG